MNSISKCITRLFLNKTFYLLIFFFLVTFSSVFFLNVKSTENESEVAPVAYFCEEESACEGAVTDQNMNVFMNYNTIMIFLLFFMGGSLGMVLLNAKLEGREASECSDKTKKDSK